MPFGKEEEEFLLGENIEMKNIVENIQIEEVKEIVIHIMGAVKRPGIVKLKKGARMVDAVEAAGGVSENADMTKVNLAFVLEDGLKIYIPNVQEKEENLHISKENGENVVISGKENVNKNKEGKQMVNINTATQSELEQLPGIGASIANRIVTYREENGKFKSLEDVKNVSGIGEAKFNNIKNFISIK